MPKTNHNRSFVDKRDYTTPPGDFCRGKHGAAKNKRGEKKFQRTRNRRHLNWQVPALIDEDLSVSVSGFGVPKNISKLRKTS